MKYFIQIYGCQMNYSDAERVAAILEKSGSEKTSKESEADLVVFVACAVRESAVARLYGNGKKFKRYRLDNPNFKAILTGCVVKKDQEKLGKIFDVIIDIKHINELPAKLGLEAKETEKEFDYFQIKPEHESPFTAYVPIMTGCNNFCSYCIVPYTRGREYSRPTQEVLNEITELVRQGYKEIILLGQNVNSYRPDEATDFPALLERINGIEGDFWIRFLTSHPKDMSEKLIKTVSESPKGTNHIHLALQSGNNDILKKMNRKYTKEHFLMLAETIRENIPDVMLTTDIIVGFPGETEEQFQETAELMRMAKFDIAYINKYSPRAGTASFEMLDDVSWEEKKRREDTLNAVLRETALENNQRYIGRTVEVLIEREDKKNYFGKTKSFKDIKIKKNETDKSTVGAFAKVKVTKVTPWALEGVIMDDD
ncbi:MAG: tRNA (N6-isopentenyl adenosine(37)-C2)-methylthiotransferase MiaB [Candidatus Pacebacteria bacterium]|nr:tRNA (N6-isopentenyl adenosine(37)-C2)-methylthiotransferase MiaB [Candidatus Paceibacterota bacterium]